MSGRAVFEVAVSSQEPWLLAETKPILLLDEPTSQMDERRSLEATQLLLDFVDAGGLVIASTRETLLLENADRVIRVQ